MKTNATTWSIDFLFDSENSGNPFRKEPELMFLWEVDYLTNTAHCVWRGYSQDILREVVKSLKANVASDSIGYRVEFPSRKGKRDGAPLEKRKFGGGAKCLPNPVQRTLVTMIEDRWGATLNEKTYMASHGQKLDFYMKSDATKETVFSFDTWDEARELAYMRK